MGPGFGEMKRCKYMVGLIYIYIYINYRVSMEVSNNG